MGNNLMGLGGFRSDNCCCSFSTLVILILIVLQFSKREKEKMEKDGKSRHHFEKDFFEDNGIIFIVALFFLSCCGCGKGFNGGY
jgi:hypothetical protein